MSHSDSNFYKSFAFVLGALVLFTLFIMYIANTLSPPAPEDPLAVAAQQKSIQPIGRSRVEGGAATATTETPATTATPTATVEVVEEVKAEEVKAEEAVVEEPVVEELVVEEPVVEEPVVEKEPVAEEVVETQVAATETAETQTTQAATATSAVAASAVAASSGNASLKVKATVATNCAGCHNVGLNGAAKPDDTQAWTALADKGIEALTMSVINGKGKMPARAESGLTDEEIAEAIHLMIAKATDGKVVAGAAK